MQDVLTSIDDPGDACAELIARANKAGGKDNVSVVVIRLDEREDTIPDDTPHNLPVAGDTPLCYDPKLATWVCAKCRRDYVDGMLFCVECGAALLPNG
jgi:hypothetical protein